MIYELTACSLCKGTGIEENRSSFNEEDSLEFVRCEMELELELELGGIK